MTNLKNLNICLSFYFYILLDYRAATEENPYCRIKQILRWYLSGFYKKPKVSLLLFVFSEF